jgi:hypothetical protein
LTETISDEKIVITAEPKQPFEERIADQKTVVYATLIDPAVIKIAAENLKCKVFAKYGFLKTKPEEVSIVSIDKYYKPYIVVRAASTRLTTTGSTSPPLKLQMTFLKCS